MTAAGLAFIAGGIATLICLRSVLFGRPKQPEGRAEPKGRAELEGRRPRSEGRPGSEGRPRQLEGRAEQPGVRARPLESRARPAEGRGKRSEGRAQRERERSTAERARRSSPRERTRTEIPRRPSLAEAALTETADLDLPTARRASWTEFDQPVFGEPEFGRRDTGQSEFDQPEFDPAGFDPAGFDQADCGQPEFDRPETRQPEFDRPETRRAEFDRPETRRAEFDRPEARRPDTPRQSRRHASLDDDDLPGGLASIGLADEADRLAEETALTEEPSAPSHRTAPAEPGLVTPGEEESRPISVRGVDRSDPAYGSRVADWVRPEYHDDPAEPSAGEYWTPVPIQNLDLPDDDPEPSARGYGWPTQVERLPAVPDYEPATGFDLTPVASEPTELVPTWPPLPAERRRRSPRRRRSRDDHRRSREDRRSSPDDHRGRPDELSSPPAAFSSPAVDLSSLLDERRDVPVEPSGLLDDRGMPDELGGPLDERRDVPVELGGLLDERPGKPGGRLDEHHGVPDERQVRVPVSWAGRNTKPADNRFLENEPRRPLSADADQRFRAPTGEPERRRPRPRPRPAASPDNNVYVSRHAADPPL